MSFLQPQADSQTASTSGASHPLSLLKSGQFLRLSPHCQGWLILQKPFYSTIVGPGSAVGGHFDIDCLSIYAIGRVEFEVPNTHKERQQAFQQRIQDITQLTEVVGELAPLRRAFRMVNLLSRWMGHESARRIPVELVGRVAAVLPKTVAIAWQQRPTEPTREHKTPTTQPLASHQA